MLPNYQARSPFVLKHTTSNLNVWLLLMILSVRVSMRACVCVCVTFLQLTFGQLLKSLRKEVGFTFYLSPHISSPH